MNRSRRTKVIFGAGCALAGALFGMVTLSNVFADGDNSTQSVLGSNLVMPYDGFLMIDSAPITGTRTIKFDLYDASGGGNSVWTETQVVNLYGGRFSVGLGTSTSLTSVVLDAEQVWLGMTIVEQDSAGNEIEVELSGRQAIEPAPFAAWSAKASDFDVAGNLTVDKDLDVAGTAYIEGQIRMGSDDKLSIEALTNSLYLAGGQSYSNGVFVGSDFTTNYNTQLGNGTDDQTTIVGPDSDGAGTAALRISKAASSSSDSMYLDENEIDATKTLYLQTNTNNNIALSGAKTQLFKNQFSIQDSGGTEHILTGEDSSYDEAGVELRVQSNPSEGEPIFRVLSQSGGERLRVEHGGKLYTDNDFEATGSATIGTDLTVNGNFTNFALSNEYTETLQGSSSGLSGSSYETMLSTTNSFCFLTQTQFDDADSDENLRCRIEVDNQSRWRLEAYMDNGGSTTYVRCKARCFSW